MKRPRARGTGQIPAGKFPFPEVIIFDVDGVLVSVEESFLRTAIETVEFFTGKRLTLKQIHAWKNRPGYNDDWKLSHVLVKRLGGKESYEEVKAKFQEIYWGVKEPGNVRHERWLLEKPALRRLKARAEVAIFTGRTRQELDHTLDGLKLRKYFDRIVTAEDVKKGKPDPEGLRIILGKPETGKAIYVGDNVDDARAAKAAGIRFVGLLPYRSEARRLRLGRLESNGALVVLGEVRELEGWLEKRSKGLARSRARKLTNTSERSS